MAKGNVVKTIHNFAELQDAYPKYKDASLNELLVDLTSSGFILSPQFYQQLQDFLAATEVNTGIPVNELAQLPEVLPDANKAYGFGASGVNRTTGLGGGGLGTAAGRDAAARALDEAQAERLRQQTLIDQQQLELQKQAAQEARRQNLLQAALSLTNTQTQERQSAREEGTKLAGYDPFRFLANVSQQAVGNVQTPYDIFKGYLNKTATAPLPQVGPNSSIDELEAAIGQLQGMQQQSQNNPTSAYGFAGGGTLPTGPLQARLVGEQGSQIAPGTEVMITGNGQTTVLPLGPGFQAGGTSPLSEASLTVLPDLFRNLRNDVSGYGFLGRGVSNTSLGYLEPGQANQGANARFNQGYGGLAEPLSLKPGYQDLVNLGKISQQDADRIVGLIGMLPNPRTAGLWLRSLSPLRQQVVESAYALAGIPPDELKAMIASSTLTGPRRAPTTIAA